MVEDIKGSSSSDQFLVLCTALCGLDSFQNDTVGKQ